MNDTLFRLCRDCVAGALLLACIYAACTFAELSAQRRGEAVSPDTQIAAVR